jgi:predicted enzyme related to lactoylglutathione lyase
MKRSSHARHPVRWFEIYVKDMKTAKAFYESVFAIKLDKLPDPGPPLR